MTFVEEVKLSLAPSAKYSELIKLLDDVTKWQLIDEGQATERFIHTSGWWFYTGRDLAAFRDNSSRYVRCSYSRLCLNMITKSEYKFVVKWLDFQNKDGL